MNPTKANSDEIEFTLNINRSNIPEDNQFASEQCFKRASKEINNDLQHLLHQIKKMQSSVQRTDIENNWSSSTADLDDKNLIINGQEVMQSWEKPLMDAMAKEVGKTKGSVLELGFGMAISAEALIQYGAQKYTVVEYNEEVAKSFDAWKQKHPSVDCQLILGKWQDSLDKLELYDGIFFDTYPISNEEYQEDEVDGLAYSHCSKFFETASKLLKPGGVFTYFSCEIDTLSRGHQRELLKHFDSFRVSVVRNLQPPENSTYWWSDSMVVVYAYK